MSASPVLLDMVPAPSLVGKQLRAKRTWVQYIRQLGDKLTTYVPLVLMAVLAGMTFWLLRLSPVPDEAQAARATPTVPDNYLVNFVARSFDVNGELTAQVAGAAAQHMPQTGELHIQTARITAWGKQGALTRSRSDDAVVNKAQTQFELTGNVVANRTQANSPDFQITSEQLFIDTDLNLMRSQLPVRVLRGVDEIKAQRMVVDNNTGVAQFNDGVEAVVQARE